MRRSSWVTLGIALILGLVVLATYGRSARESASRMTPAVARSVLEEGIHALEQKRVDDILGMVAPDGDILGLRQDDLRSLLSKAVQQVPGHLSVTYHSLTVAKQEGREAEVIFDMSVGETSGSPPMKAVYFSNLRAHLVLERVSSDGWLGIGSGDRWMIKSMSTDPPVEFTPP